MPGDLAVMVGALPFRPGAHTNFVKLHSVGAVRRVSSPRRAASLIARVADRASCSPSRWRLDGQTLQSSRLAGIIRRMRIGINALFLQKPIVGGWPVTCTTCSKGWTPTTAATSTSCSAHAFGKAYQVSFPQIAVGSRFGTSRCWTKMARLGENVEKLWWEQMGLVQAADAREDRPAALPVFRGAADPDLPDRRHDPRRDPAGAARVQVARGRAGSTPA